MTRARLLGRTAVASACVGVVLAAPSAAMALTTHSASSSTPNTSGILVATAKCASNQSVVSGGFKTSDPRNSFGAVVSHAVHGGWSVQIYGGHTLTTYAYCAPKGQFSISKHEKQVTTQAAPINTVATARCSSGESLVSGGYAFIPPTAGQGNSPTFRDYAAGARKWTVMAAVVGPPANLASFAYCAPGVSVKVRSASSAIPGAPAPGLIHGSATASCHKGEMLLSGGYTTTPTPDWDDTTGPDFFYGGSHRSGARSWTASAYNSSRAGGTLTTFAYCMP